MTALEFWATVFAFLYVGMTIREMQLSWLISCASSLLYIFLFWNSALYLQSILQIFFIAISIYGWWAWDVNRQPAILLGRMSWIRNINLLLTTLVFGVLAWELLKNFSDSKSPAMDALTTVASISATFLLIHKKIETWYYWIIINLVSIVMFFMQDLFMTSFVYAGFMVLSFLGLKAWQTKS